VPRQKVNKEELILRAMKVFRSKGYYHSSVADLAQACGIEKPHFYYYFEDKEHLMREVLLFVHGFVKKYIIDKAYNEDYTVQQRIRKMMENCRRFNIEDMSGCIMGNTILETSGHDERFEAILKAYMEDWIAGLTYLLAKKHPPADAERKARECLNELQGSMIMMRLYRDPYHFYKATEKVEALIS